ncbi:MAG: hemerythrin domain-containing protein [Bdellovibrionales bacterium]|nr:hemerythrin domain-containing protein [Massilia sp.]
MSFCEEPTIDMDNEPNTNPPSDMPQGAFPVDRALHTHSRVEESVFYPGVRNVEPGMIGHFEQEHLRADDLLTTLQGMQTDDPRSEQLMRELIDMSLHHMQEEEEQFFPMLEQASWT